MIVNCRTTRLSLSLSPAFFHLHIYCCLPHLIWQQLGREKLLLIVWALLTGMPNIDRTGLWPARRAHRIGSHKMSWNLR